MAEEPRLPCGQPVGDVLDAVADPDVGLTEHQRDCPHCRAAAAELVQLWQPVRAAAGPSARLPTEYLDGLVDRLRRELRRPAAWAELPASGGRLRVATSVIADVARAAAAHDVDDVGVVSSRVTGDALTLDVVLRYGVAGPSTLAALRTRVRAVVTSLLGVGVTTIEVRVVDIVLPPDESGPQLFSPDRVGVADTSNAGRTPR